jgi:hypothetical protein
LGPKRPNAHNEELQSPKNQQIPLYNIKKHCTCLLESFATKACAFVRGSCGAHHHFFTNRLHQIWYRDFSDLKEHTLSFKTQGRLHRLVVYGVCTIFSCTNVVLLEHFFLNRLQTG